MSTNALGDQGITALADALTANSTLTFLDVHACGIHDSGATALAGALQNNCTLAVLNLKANYITDAGAIALAQVAIKSKTLKALITTSNDIERAGEKALEVVRARARIFQLALSCKCRLLGARMPVRPLPATLWCLVGIQLSENSVFRFLICDTSQDAIYENENLVDFLPAEVRGGMR